MARQGHAFVTAQEVRVVYQDDRGELTDVPADGKTVGEIVTRGNIVMKEVRARTHEVLDKSNLDGAVFQGFGGDEESFPRRVFQDWRPCCDA